MKTHKHHIIPKHLGGTNDSSNLIKVTVKEHAQIHYNLWMIYGRWQDKLAYKGLTARIGKEDIIRELCRIGGKITGSKPKSKQHKQSLKKSWTKERKTKRSLAYKGEGNPNYNIEGRINPTLGSKRPDRVNINQYMLEKGTHPSQIKWKCQCGVEGKGTVNAKRWHFENCKEKI
jgi:hypothetical protein